MVGMDVWVLIRTSSDNTSYIDGIFENEDAANATVIALASGEHDRRSYTRRYPLLTDRLPVERALWLYWQYTDNSNHVMFTIRELSRVPDDEDGPYPECRAKADHDWLFCAEGTDRERVKREFRAGVIAMAANLGVPSRIDEIDEALKRVP